MTLRDLTDEKSVFSEPNNYYNCTVSVISFIGETTLRGENPSVLAETCPTTSLTG